MLRIRQLASVAVFAVCAFLAHSALAAPPLIASATLNAAATQVTIKGINFAGVPTVILASTPLAIVSQSATQIVANLPAGLAAGNYILIVQIGNKAGNSDRFAFAFGGTGPLRVLDSAGKQVGYNFDGESVVVLISGFPPVRLSVRRSGFFDNPIDQYFASTDCSGPALLLTDPDLLVLDRTVVGVSDGNFYVPMGSGSVTLLQSFREFGGECNEQFPFQLVAAPMTVIPISSLGFAPSFTIAP